MEDDNEFNLEGSAAEFVLMKYALEYFATSIPRGDEVRAVLLPLLKKINDLVL